MRETFDEHLRRTLESVRDRVGLDLADALGRARADLAAALDLERSETAALTASERAADLDALESATDRTLDAVRALDGATSLSQTLDALAAGARAHTDRFALLLLRGDALRGWASTGYDGLQEGSEFPLAVAGVLAEAVRTRGAATLEADGWEGRPQFAADSTGALVVVPVALDREVVALLCAEPRPGSAGGPHLAVTLELLARHAARVLELLTARRLAQLAPVEPGGRDAEPVWTAQARA